MLVILAAMAALASATITPVSVSRTTLLSPSIGSLLSGNNQAKMEGAMILPLKCKF
jgi:hypothetical protein